MKIQPAIRWVLIPIVAIATFYGCFVLGVLALMGIELLCPQYTAYLSEHRCFYAVYMDIAIGFFPTLAAVLIVWFTYLIAPAYKFFAALVSYGVGAVIAIILAIEAQLSGTLVLVLSMPAILLIYLYARDQNDG